MALKYQALDSGAIQFAQELSAVASDGSTISDTRLFVLAPGADLSGQTDEVKAICALWWTPEHIAAWGAIVAATPVPLTEDEVAANG